LVLFPALGAPVERLTVFQKAANESNWRLGDSEQMPYGEKQTTSKRVHMPLGHWVSKSQYCIQIWRAVLLRSCENQIGENIALASEGYDLR